MYTVFPNYSVFDQFKKQRFLSIHIFFCKFCIIIFFKYKKLLRFVFCNNNSSKLIVVKKLVKKFLLTEKNKLIKQTIQTYIKYKIYKKTLDLSIYLSIYLSMHHHPSI